MTRIPWSPLGGVTLFDPGAYSVPAVRIASKRSGTRTSGFLAASLDGFIARKNGDIDWLQTFSKPTGEDYGYDAFVSRIDALVVGRGTYEKVRTFKSWPYGSLPVIVLSHHRLQIPPDLKDRVESMSGSPKKVVAALARRGLRRLYVDGGRTLQGFLSAGALDELIVNRIPVLLGRGIPLFGLVPRDILLRHVRTRAFRSGLVQSTYEVRDDAQRAAAKTRRSRRTR